MKTIDAKLPGFVDLFIEGNRNKYLIRRDFVEDSDHLELGVTKRGIKKNEFIKPILEAGLLFFNELNINGYVLEYHLTKGMPKGFNLVSNEMLQAFTIYGLNEVMNTKLSNKELNNICSKLSINIDTFVCNGSVCFNQDKEIINRGVNTSDIYYLVFKLPNGFTQDEILRYFMKGEAFTIEIEDMMKYEVLFNIREILKVYNAKIVSTNGFSNYLVATFNDVHDRFKAAAALDDYELHKFNRGTGYTLLKCYR